MENKYIHITKVVWTNACRFLLAAVFLFSGFVKAVDPLGSTYKITDYLQAFGLLFDGMPHALPLLMAIVLAALEFVLGVMLLFGIRKQFSTTLVLLFMCFMTPLTLYLAIADPVSDCGCFGDAWVLTNWQTFYKNAVLITAAASVYAWQKQIIRFITRKSEWLISLYSTLFVIALSMYCLMRLPILDFRPYRIGNNIAEQMSIPPDAELSVYETVFVLEKDGQTAEFTIDNYPDSTWTFKDARTVLRKKGYEPAIQDFSMMDLETGEDITSRVLTHDNYCFLLVAHRIEEADDSNIDLINEIYDYSVEHGYGFYGLTSSTDADIEEWKDKTGAEYPFCLMDDITLKTIIRSNPGLVLIKAGTVVNKWNCRDLPDEYELTDSLDKLPLARQATNSTAHTMLLVLLWFFVPLLAVLTLDLAVIRRRERKAESRKEATQKGTEEL